RLGQWLTGLRPFSYLQIIFRSLSRNLLRTSLTYVAIFVLVFIVCAIWSILSFIDKTTVEKESDLKVIVTEKFQIPSQMPPRYEKDVLAIANALPQGMRPKNGDDDIMTWAFVGGSLDPANRTLENTLFFFCMEPRKLLTMMGGLEELTGEERRLLEKGVAMMNANKRAIIVGPEKLKMIKKRVGDRVQLTSFNYKDLAFD